MAIKTTVVVQATITVLVDEIWQDSAPISQVSKDAVSKATNILQAVKSSSYTIGDIRQERIVLKVDKD